MGSTGGSSGTGVGALDGSLDLVNGFFTFDTRSLKLGDIFLVEVEDTVEGKEQAAFVETRELGPFSRRDQYSYHPSPGGPNTLAHHPTFPPPKELTVRALHP